MAAPRQPSHRPRGLGGCILPRPRKREYAYSTDPQARRYLHRTNHVVHVLSKLRMLFHTVQFEIGEMNLLERIADVDQEDLKPVARHLLPNAVHRGIIQLAH